MVRTIPGSVKTPLTELVLDIGELNAREDKKIFLMLVEQNNDTIMVGANTVSDIIFYSSHFSSRIEEIEDPDNMIIIRGTIADPADLPYDQPLSAKIYVMHSDMETESFFYMDTATKHIEDLLRLIPKSEIDDFGVVLGTVLNDKIKSKVLEKIKLKKAMHEGGG